MLMHHNLTVSVGIATTHFFFSIGLCEDLIPLAVRWRLVLLLTRDSAYLKWSIVTVSNTAIKNVVLYQTPCR